MPDAARPRNGESGVTPIIGTILVLVITVAGMGVTLFFGTPVIARLQDQAALEAMVAQMQHVRHATNSISVEGTARSPGFSLSSGTLALRQGPSVIIGINGSASLPGTCVLDLIGWFDNDSEFDVGTLGCPGLYIPLPPALPLGLPNPNPCAGEVIGNVTALLAGRACLVIYPDEAFSEPLDLEYAPLTPDRYRITLQDGPLLSDTNYYIELNNCNPQCNQSSQVYASAWLLRTDAIHWSAGQVAATLAYDAIVSYGHGSAYLASPIRMTENTSRVLMILPQVVAQEGSLSGTGAHAIHLIRGPAQTRWFDENSTFVRFDFAGLNAREFCNGLLVRDRTAYQTGLLQPDCALDTTPTLGFPDDDYTVTYNPVEETSIPPTGPQTLQVTLLQVRIDARLRI